MCTNINRIDLARKLCCQVNPYLHCVGYLTCGGIFCQVCAGLHNCRVSGQAKEWVDQDTHLEAPVPEYMKTRVVWSVPK